MRGVDSPNFIFSLPLSVALPPPSAFISLQTKVLIGDVASGVRRCCKGVIGVAWLGDCNCEKLTSLGSKVGSGLGDDGFVGVCATSINVGGHFSASASGVGVCDVAPGSACDGSVSVKFPVCFVCVGAASFGAGCTWFRCHVGFLLSLLCWSLFLCLGSFLGQCRT